MQERAIKREKVAAVAIDHNSDNVGSTSVTS